jgi:hypothetical protein
MCLELRKGFVNISNELPAIECGVRRICLEMRFDLI